MWYLHLVNLVTFTGFCRSKICHLFLVSLSHNSTSYLKIPERATSKYKSNTKPFYQYKHKPLFPCVENCSHSHSYPLQSITYIPDTVFFFNTSNIISFPSSKAWKTSLLWLKSSLLTVLFKPLVNLAPWLFNFSPRTSS